MCEAKRGYFSLNLLKVYTSETMPCLYKVLLALPLPAFDYVLSDDALFFHRQSPRPNDGDDDSLSVGLRVVISWQSKLRIGLILAKEQVPARQLYEKQAILAVLDDTPLVSESALRSLMDLSQKSYTPIGLYASNFFSGILKEDLEHQFSPIASTGLSLPSGEELVLGQEYDATQLEPKELDFYRSQGLVRERIAVKKDYLRVLKAQLPFDSERVQEYVKPKARSKQALALALISQSQGVDNGSEFCRQHDLSRSSIQALLKEGLLVYDWVEKPQPIIQNYRAPNDGLEAVDHLPVLSPSIKHISGGKRQQRLKRLLPLLQMRVARGESCLLLAPESFHVEEAAKTLAAYLPCHVYSGEHSDGVKKALWLQLREEAAVLITSYSGLLINCYRLGLIVLLESSHESYKLLSGSQLFVPRLVRMYAQELGIPLVETEAVLSPENAHRYPEEQRLRLPTPKLRLHVSDLSKSRDWPFSADLIRVLKQVEERRRQAVILVPRRGYSTALSCKDCSWTAQCPNCDLALRYHKQGYRLRCHQCSFETPLPSACPNCQSALVMPTRLAGTQWLFETLQAMLPNIAWYRLDSDFKSELEPLYRGEAGVLIATSAVFRQTPLPKISLIVHSLFESQLDLSDFRAEEYALNLLYDLSELSPQERTLVLVQTLQPDQKAFEVFDQDRSESYVKDILERRARFGYPPFSAMARVQISAKKDLNSVQASEQLAEQLRLAGAKEHEILGPAPAPIRRLRSLYLYTIILRCADEARLTQLLAICHNFRGKATVRIDVDARATNSFLEPH